MQGLSIMRVVPEMLADDKVFLDCSLECTMWLHAQSGKAVAWQGASRSGGRVVIHKLICVYMFNLLYITYFRVFWLYVGEGGVWLVLAPRA